MMVAPLSLTTMLMPAGLEYCVTWTPQRPGVKRFSRSRDVSRGLTAGAGAELAVTMLMKAGIRAVKTATLKDCILVVLV